MMQISPADFDWWLSKQDTLNLTDFIYTPYSDYICVRPIDINQVKVQWNMSWNGVEIDEISLVLR